MVQATQPAVALCECPPCRGFKKGNVNWIQRLSEHKPLALLSVAHTILRFLSYLSPPNESQKFHLVLNQRNSCVFMRVQENWLRWIMKRWYNGHQ